MNQQIQITNLNYLELFLINYSNESIKLESKLVSLFNKTSDLNLNGYKFKHEIGA